MSAIQTDREEAIFWMATLQSTDLFRKQAQVEKKITESGELVLKETRMKTMKYRKVWNLKKPGTGSD